MDEEKLVLNQDLVALMSFASKVLLVDLLDFREPYQYLFPELY